MEGGKAAASAKGIQIISFGCRLNTVEAEIMRGHAASSGVVDTCIINTCAVTSRAERQARQTIRKLRRSQPNTRIVVTGCAAQIKPQSFAAMPEVDRVLGNDIKLNAATWQSLDNTPRISVNDLSALRDTAHHMVQDFEGMARAFVQVQNGCDHRCTFCIIPYGRGPSRSVPMGQIAEQIGMLVQQGYPEVVFTGVDITSYGHDLPGTPSLGQMARRVLALNPGLKQLRFSSLDPAEIDEDMWQLIAHEPRLMPHLHLSVQAGDDMVLKRMKRRHTRQQILRLCTRAKQLRPDIVFGADIIAGFPTETDAMFENTLALVKEAGLTWLHVFPYSPREGTPAAKMPPVPERVRKERAEKLRCAGQQAANTLMASMLGKTQPVLIENNTAGQAIARTANYAEVRLETTAPAGHIIPAHLDHVVKIHLVATAI